MYTIDDLVPGAVFYVDCQSMNITPRSLRVEVVAVDCSRDQIWYKGGSQQTTSISRFLSVINDRPMLPLAA